MNISNLEDTRSRRDYNRYQIEYKSTFEIGEIPIASFVLVETLFTAISFPTVKMSVTNYIGEVMADEAPEMIGEYHMEPRIKKHSRHIYDIYKLLPLVKSDESFKIQRFCN